MGEGFLWVGGSPGWGVHLKVLGGGGLHSTHTWFGAGGGMGERVLKGVVTEHPHMGFFGGGSHGWGVAGGGVLHSTHTCLVFLGGGGAASTPRPRSG